MIYLPTGIRCRPVADARLSVVQDLCCTKLLHHRLLIRAADGDHNPGTRQGSKLQHPASATPPGARDEYSLLPVLLAHGGVTVDTRGIQRLMYKQRMPRR